LPTSGTVFISVLDQYKERIVPIARRLETLGFDLCATAGTAAVLSKSGVAACLVRKVREGRPNIVDMIKNRDIQLIINTPAGLRGKDDASAIRREALARQVPTITTIPGAAAAVTGLESLARGELKVLSLQEYHAGKRF
jgi:carbamoyl-phosphate synthase large subunit